MVAPGVHKFFILSINLTVERLISCIGSLWSHLTSLLIAKRTSVIEFHKCHLWWSIRSQCEANNRQTNCRLIGWQWFIFVNIFEKFLGLKCPTLVRKKTRHANTSTLWLWKINYLPLSYHRFGWVKAQASTSTFLSQQWLKLLIGVTSESPKDKVALLAS